MKEIGKVLAVALFVSTVWMSPAHAAAAWFKCEVEQAGMPTSSMVVIRFTHLADVPAFTDKTFVATSENVKEIFATALTAISANLPVWIFADPDLATPPLNTIYLAKE